jgi:hypothetical protein
MADNKTTLPSTGAGAGRGGQGGPTAEELSAERNRKYRQAMQAEYDSRAKMLGKTTEQYVKDQSAKEKAALEKEAASGFLSDSGYKKGGMTASKRADGIAQKGKTRGTIVMCGGGYMKGKK